MTLSMHALMAAEYFPARLFWPKEPSRIEGKSIFIPIIFLPGAIPYGAGSDWMRQLKTEGRQSDLTIAQAGGTVVMFLNHLSVRLDSQGKDISLEGVTESDIRRWRNLIEQRGTAKTANRRVKILLKFLKYLRVTGRFPVDVFLKKNDPELPEAIHISRLLSKESKSPFLPVPTKAEMTAVQVAISAHGNRYVERNMCILLWAKEAGLRNSEIANLKKTQLPSFAKIESWKRENITPRIIISGKGLKSRIIEPPISLVERTIELVQASPNDSEFVFVSEKGAALRQQTISHMYTRFFRISGSEHTIHRVRAHYLYNLILAKLREISQLGPLDDFSVSTCIAFVLDKAGHESVRTLRYYIRLAALSLMLKYPATLDE